MVHKKAFTIVELLVAMGLVVILMALSSVIFATAVKAHRAADSTIEITRRVEAISEQLTADLRGLRTDMPLAVWFERDPATGRRFDQILFFANGNYRTIKQYDSNSDNIPDKTVQGNLSRIYYGHGWQVNTASAAFQQLYISSGLLSRRAHVLTSDASLPVPGAVSLNMIDPAQFAASFLPAANNLFEYDQAAQANWQNLVQVTAMNDRLLLTCFSDAQDLTNTGRPMIDMDNPQTLHLLLGEYVSEFKVQWAYTCEDLLKGATGLPYIENELFVGVRWWPDAAVDDFGLMGGINKNAFGIYFGMPGGTALLDWYPVSVCKTNLIDFVPDYVPRTMKLTVTVHDAKGLFPNGRTFTQIVPIR